MGLSREQDRQIEQLYNEMYHPLLAYACSVLDNSSLAEEAVQDAFRIACAKANDLYKSENPKGWLTKTLQYVIRNMIRSRARLNNLVIQSLVFEDTFMVAGRDESDTDMIYSDLLGSEDYMLLKRIVVYKYTMLEAAQELGISVEACKKRVQRTRKKLKKLLEENNLK